MTDYFIQGSEAWKKKRQQCVTATDAAVIIGTSPWKNAEKLWKQKLGLELEDEPNERMNRGTLLEPKAREKFEEMICIKMPPKVVFHKDYPYFMASLDGYNEELNCLLEIKCNGKSNHRAAEDKLIPPYYYAQMQFQLACSGAMKAFYFSFDGANGIILEVEPEKEYIEKMLEMCESFYQCMDTLKNPNTLIHYEVI